MSLHHQDAHPHTSLARQFLNLLGCLLLLPLFHAATVYTRWPATVDLCLAVGLAELCRFANDRRRAAWREAGAQPRRDKEDDDVDVEWKGANGTTTTIRAVGDDDSSNGNNALAAEAMASIVGWREDPALWRRCLESYKHAVGCRFVLVGIDGHDADDKEMVDIFQKVYPERSLVISLDEPLGEVANAIRARELRARQKLHGYQGGGAAVVEDEVNEVATRACLALARHQLEDALERHGHGGGAAHLGGPDGVKYLLVNQRHLHKKGIMFTTFIFSTVIADMLGLEFVWTSDSDTIVRPNSIEGTINTVAGDPRAGGASSGLVVHNAADTVATKLASVIYWCELYLARSLPGSVAVSDCQSGPSAAFRLSAIQPILVPWYNQTVFGQRMIVNEDRHLTTLLLLRGWRVIYAGDILTATETPTTVVRWIRQQVRWARAQHIESLLLPRVYLINHPFLFLSAIRRELAPLVVFVQCFLYLFTDLSLLSFNMPDMGLRIAGMMLYNFVRNPDRQAPGALLLWMVPGLLFYNVPLPAVEAWSLVTMTADTWGNSMRSGTEIVKKDGLRKRWFESGFLVVWMGAVGAMLAKWTASRMLLTGSQTLLWQLVAAAVGAVVSWKITIQDA